MTNDTKDKIMIVDDIPSNISPLFDFLNGKGFRVLVAQDGESAIQKAQEAKPDLILLDVMMPGMDGFETIQHLKAGEDTNTIPVIFMTSLSETEYKVRGLTEGAVDYVTKPLQHEEVLARITTHLTIRKLQLSLEEKTKTLQFEIKMAKKIQESLLPSEKPEMAGAAVAWKYEPMMDVGGDLLDLHHDPASGLLGFFVCDVTGHGVAAAFLSTMVKMSLRNWAAKISQPAGLISDVKTNLTGKMANYNITAGAGFLDLNTGKAVLARAGHPAFIVLRKDGAVELVKPRGRILVDSVQLSSNSEDQEVQLNTGDRVILYTDGITEARQPEGTLMLEEEGFTQVLTKNHALNLDELCERVYQEVVSFAGTSNLEDDFTLLIVEYTGA